jgi:ADP-heptose:LPS heptosyltransferase
MVTRRVLAPSPRPAAPRHLVIYMMLPLGDTLFALPTLAALRRRYPEARLTAIADPQTAPLVQAVPSLDTVLELHPVPGGRPAAYLRVARHLRAVRPDCALNLTSPWFLWLSLAGGIPRTRSMRFDTLWWLWPAQHARWKAQHAAKHFYDCAGAFDLPAWDQVDHVPRFTLPRSAVDRARAILADRLDGAAPATLVGIHAGGAWLDGLKRWPVDHFLALCRALVSRFCTIVLLGDSRDREVNASLAVALGRHCLDATGRLDLLACLALVADLDLFVGNDSGLLHTAAALGTPYVGIFGPTSLTSFAPLSRYPGQGVCVTPVVPCRAPRHFVGGEPLWRRPCCKGICSALRQLPLETVYAGVDAVLAGAQLSPSRAYTRQWRASGPFRPLPIRP